MVQSMRAVSAEFIATALFVFVGAGTVITSSDTLAIAVAHGLAIALLVAAIGRISGGHINPAVTFGAVLGGRMNPLLGVLYIAAQIGGAVVGAVLLKVVFIDQASTVAHLGAHTITFDIISNEGSAVLVEAILTFVLVFTVFATAIDKRGPAHLAPIAIGLAVLVGHLVGVPLTGASMNPARSFGPAAIANFWDFHWVYWAGPLLGGGLAATLYTFLFMGGDDKGVGEPEPVAPEVPDEGE